MQEKTKKEIKLVVVIWSAVIMIFGLGAFGGWLAAKGPEEASCWEVTIGDEEEASEETEEEEKEEEIEYAYIGNIESTVNFEWKEGHQMIGGIDDWTLIRFMSYYTVTDEPLIYLNTDGGDSDVALAIYDIIRSGDKEVTIVAVGDSFSAGFVIFLAADHRYVTKNTVMMAHPAWGYPEELLAIHQSLLLRIFEEHGVSSIFEEDTWLNAKDMKNLGLLDGII